MLGEQRHAALFAPLPEAVEAQLLLAPAGQHPRPAAVAPAELVNHPPRCRAAQPPAAHRAVAVAAAPLPPSLAPLLRQTFDGLVGRLSTIFPPITQTQAPLAAFRSSGAHLTADIGGVAQPTVFRPHLLLCGEAGSGQAPLAAALMHALEHCHRYSLELPQLVADGSRSPQESCSLMFAEARRTSPAVILMPSIDSWLLDAAPLLFNTLALLV